MTPLRDSLILLGFFLGFPFAASVQGEPLGSIPRQPSQASNQTKHDLFGDPLPIGAVARMGSARWRVDEGSAFLRYAPDGKSLIVVSEDNCGILTPTTCLLNLLDADDGRSL